MNINYYSNFYSTALSFCVPIFGLSRICQRNLCSKLRISCGCWIKLTIDDPVNPSLEQVAPEEQIYHNLRDNQIRLLKLFPAHSHEPLQGELSTCSLFSDNPEYAAVSYVWGSTNHVQTIRLHDDQVPITRSVGECLRRLRKETHAVVLWIDSICINQVNMEEKSTQVRMMDEIYACARKVQIWLGPEQGHSSIGMEVLKHFATNPRPSLSAPWQSLPPDLVALGLSEVMRRAWFERIWVVQEAGLSRKTHMLCGNQDLIWTNDPVKIRQFTRMIKWAAIQPEWRNSDLVRIDMRPLLELLDLQLGQQLDRGHGTSHRQAPDILDIAYDLRHRLSSDPRDMVFALQGLVKHNFSGERLQPDYRLTVDQTYEHLASVIEF